MSNFSTRLDGNTSSQLVNTTPTRKTSQTEHTGEQTSLPEPQTTTKGSQTGHSGTPTSESLLSQESGTELNQKLETTSSSTMGKRSTKLPRISGLQTSEPLPEIKPSETLIQQIKPDTGVKNVSIDVNKVVEKFSGSEEPPETLSTPEPNQLEGVVVLGVSPDTRSVRGTFTVSNMGNSGVTLALSGGFSLTNTTERLDQDERILQTRSRQGNLSVGLSGDVGGSVPVSGSIGVSGGYDIAYARQLKSGEKLSQARETQPPSRDEISENPTQTLNPGDEIAFRGYLSVGVSVGAIEPNSGVKFSVGVEVKNEFITSIKRNSGEPPTFRLHIEPSNRNLDGTASVGWGPFAMTGGVGYASTVYYEFDMTPEALSGFLKTGKLPEIPDPSRYLRPGTVLTTETFKPFQDQARDSGITIVGFGATKSLTKSLELSATVGKVSTSSSKMRGIYVQNGEVLRQDVHTMMASRSAWFKGELSTSLALTQNNRYTEIEGQSELQQEYVGLEASFKISDSQTSQEDLSQRVDQVNHLLGRSRNNPLELPTRTDGKWGNSSVQVKAKITPEVIERLSQLDLSSGNAKFQMEFMEREYGVPAEDVRKLISDLKALSVGPDKDSVRREQGLRIAGFLASGYTSVVNDDELKRIAVLDRMLGGGVAELAVASTVHTEQLNKLGVDGFLSETRSERLGEISRSIGTTGHDLSDLKSRLSGKTWDRFNVGAQKLNALEQVRANISQDTLLEPQERERLLKTVDEQMSGLGQLMGQLLESEQGRGKVMSGLLGAGSLLPKAIYTSPEEMFDDPLVKGLFLDQVVGSAFLHDATPGELSNLLTCISQQGKGSAGIDQVFKILSLAEVNGVQKEVLDAMQPDDLANLFPRMNREQQSAMLNTLLEVTGLERERMDEIMTLIEKSREKSDERYEKFQDSLDKLNKEFSKLESELPKDKHLMEHFKRGYKEVDRPLQSLQEKIDANQELLGQVGHASLKSKAQELEGRLEEFFNQMDILTPGQRQDLFKQLLKQDSLGETSQAMLRRLIAGSQSEMELTGFAQSLHDRLRKNENTTKLPHRVSSLKETRIALQECLLDIQLRLS